MRIRNLLWVLAVGGASLLGLARCGDYSAPPGGGTLPDGGMPRLPDGGSPPPPGPYLNGPANEAQ